MAPAGTRVLAPCKRPPFPTARQPPTPRPQGASRPRCQLPAPRGLCSRASRHRRLLPAAGQRFHAEEARQRAGKRTYLHLLFPANNRHTEAASRAALPPSPPSVPAHPPHVSQALELLAASPRLQGGALPLAVAFNPYFPDVARREEERGRLRRKLEAGQGRIATIYLQAGSGAAQLEDSLRWLGRLLDELAAGAAGQQGEQRGEQRGEQQGEQQAPPGGRPAKRRRRQAPAAVAPAGLPERLRVFGSLLVPSKKLLAQMKFRPWAGVFLRWLAWRRGGLCGQPRAAPQPRGLAHACWPSPSLPACLQR